MFLLHVLYGRVDFLRQLHHLQSSVRPLGGRVVGRVVGGQQRDHHGEHNVKERQEPETHDYGKQQVGVERVAHLDAAVEAETVVHVGAEGSGDSAGREGERGGEPFRLVERYTSVNLGE